jgi:predicted SAM-dependent methyltransferase
MRARIAWGKAVRLVARPPPPRHPGGERFVHLGCGPINHPAFINVDAVPLPHVHYVGSIARLPMFRDDTVDLLYASHCLEHISYHKTHEVLAEWYRVLKPGGVLRVSVPDLDRLIEIYEADGRNVSSIIGQLYGGHDSPYNVHMAIFNRTGLEQLMTSVGFENCRLWSPHGDHLSDLTDFASFTKRLGEVDYPVSLNIEAAKPRAI